MSPKVPWSWLAASSVVVTLAGLLWKEPVEKAGSSIQHASCGTPSSIPDRVAVESRNDDRAATEVMELPATPPATVQKGETALERLELALSLPIGTEREGALSSAAHDLKLEDALKLLEIIPQGAERDAIVSGIMDALIMHSPSDGALLFAALPEADCSHRLVNQLINPWASSSPAEAAAWTAGLPMGGPREDATIAVVQSWITADATAATAWLLSLPKNGLRDRALVFSVQQLADRAPDLAVDLALQITQETLKVQTLDIVSRY